MKVMQSVTDKSIVLKLNRLWMPTGFARVDKSIVDMVSGVAQAIAIDYEIVNDEPDYDQVKSMTALDWDDWIALPVRSWELAIHSPSITIRVPTVLVAREFAEMPIRKFHGKPNSFAVWLRDKGIDQYTGRKLQEQDASMDHVVPYSRGGRNEWDNVALTDKSINFRKGSHLNSEVGLRLIRKPTAPAPVPASALIGTIRHPSWKAFMVHQK
jgi:5-methylcytosine-specific restriction endonuclease McrA